MSAAAAGRSATIRSISSSAAAASPAGKPTGAATGCGSKPDLLFNPSFQILARPNTEGRPHGTDRNPDCLGRIQVRRLSRRSDIKAERRHRRDPEIFGVNSHIRNICDRLANEVMSPSRPRSSIASSLISSVAIRRKKSPWRGSSSPHPTGRRCCAIRRRRSMW